jgi:predicted nucleic acid-binding protein
VTRFAIDPATLVQLGESNHTIDSNHQLVAPNSIRSMALDLLLQRVRNGELTEAAAMALHERMTESKIRLLGDRVSRRTAWQIAMAHGWNTIRLAEYLAVATLQADVLVAADPELAMKAAGVVPLATLADLMAPAP